MGGHCRKTESTGALPLATSRLWFFCPSLARTRAEIAQIKHQLPCACSVLNVLRTPTARGHLARVTTATPKPPSLKTEPAKVREAGGLEPVVWSITWAFPPAASGRSISNSRSRLFTSKTLRSPLGLTDACVVTYPGSLEVSTILSPGRKLSWINLRTQNRAFA